MISTPCTYCEERPGVVDSPDPKAHTGSVCQTCHDYLDAEREEREAREEAERREDAPYDRADHERDMAKDRIIFGDDR